MSIGDNAQNQADELGGQAKAAFGNLTDDPSLQAEGQADQATANVKQATANVKQAGEKAKRAASDVAAGVAGGSGVINRLHRGGFKSEYAYIGAFGSIALSLVSWVVSRNKTGDSKAQSDRWGIFIGHWAPTFMALGIALKLEEES